MRETWEQAKAEQRREREKAGKLSDQNIFYVYGYMIGALKGKLSKQGIELSGSDLGKLEAEAIRAYKADRQRIY